MGQTWRDHLGWSYTPAAAAAEEEEDDDDDVLMYDRPGRHRSLALQTTQPIIEHFNLSTVHINLVVTFPPLSHTASMQLS